MSFPYEQQVSLQLSQEAELIEQRNFLSNVTLRCYEVIIGIFRRMVYLDETLGGQN
jgi:hypothetical protein